MPLVVDHYHYNHYHLDHHDHLHLSILGLGPIGGVGDAALARSGASAPVSNQLLTKKFTSATAEAESASKIWWWFNRTRNLHQHQHLVVWFNKVFTSNDNILWVGLWVGGLCGWR